MAKQINIDVFWCRDALNKAPQGISAQDVAYRYIDGFKERMKIYGFDTDMWPASPEPTVANTLPWPTTINLPEHDAFVRRMAHERHPSPKALPVIFATLNEASRAELGKDGKPLSILGWVPDEKVVTKDWKDFVLINTLRVSTLGYPLVHEMGHAAGLDHVEDTSNIMFYGPFFGTNNLTAAQLATIGKAYFVGQR